MQTQDSILTFFNRYQRITNLPTVYLLLSNKSVANRCET